ncbi:MAG: aminotransferase class I/II-fold pyridoxal phosphate-dependent enzyme [Chloroflexi bacterium]|nr:aminotransferase class I/II-fold pyridoxal phosphate-dependent enzyme [Chloroflexota bacterium]
MTDPARVDGIQRRINAIVNRVDSLTEHDLYFFNQPITEILSDSKVLVRGREMGMYASYGYLGLLGHPRIGEAAIRAVEKYGTGTHGVRMLAGTLDLHCELEATIAAFKGAEDAVTYSSGYVTNLTTVSALVGRHDYVFSDKLNHASIVDGCLLSGARFVRFRHNEIGHLEELLQKADPDAARLVVVDAVFSMDGDIVDLPALARVCRAHNAWLMVDEAHSIGVLGATGRGIEEHFGLHDAVDIKMGTLSKTIPSVGGYVAGRKDLIKFMRNAARGFIFSAALPPAQAAAAREAFNVILDEPWRVEKLRRNARQFIDGLKARGFDTMNTETAIVPVLCGADDTAFAMVRRAQGEDIFVLPVVSPAVPEDTARLRATVTAAHNPEHIEHAMDVLERAGRAVGVI